MATTRHGLPLNQSGHFVPFALDSLENILIQTKRLKASPDFCSSKLLLLLLRLKNKVHSISLRGSMPGRLRISCMELEAKSISEDGIRSNVGKVETERRNPRERTKKEKCKKLKSVTIPAE
ncbi:hypothetical protein VNO77_08878 [Canavalia gladiata]|uniref:Uncharacterized protein n=1 Tax=Canavalia gladiata TaxID=3824 RepID=A0AAN9M9I8_CANGL